MDSRITVLLCATPLIPGVSLGCDSGAPAGRSRGLPRAREPRQRLAAQRVLSAPFRAEGGDSGLGQTAGGWELELDSPLNPSNHTSTSPACPAGRAAAACAERTVPAVICSDRRPCHRAAARSRLARALSGDGADGPSCTAAYRLRQRGEDGAGGCSSGLPLTRVEGGRHPTALRILLGMVPRHARRLVAEARGLQVRARSLWVRSARRADASDRLHCRHVRGKPARRCPPSSSRPACSGGRSRSSAAAAPGLAGRAPWSSRRFGAHVVVCGRQPKPGGDPGRGRGRACEGRVCVCARRNR